MCDSCREKLYRVYGPQANTGESDSLSLVTLAYMTAAKKGRGREAEVQSEKLPLQHERLLSLLS